MTCKKLSNKRIIKLIPFKDLGHSSFISLHRLYPFSNRSQNKGYLPFSAWNEAGPKKKFWASKILESLAQMA